ncbi:MAG: hypothetical protein HYY96_00595 [Candidatus Tectomicrobia bacterium]|nr:hypothetical protein [Candidatus Tectomicrobia bacterium]
MQRRPWLATLRSAALLVAAALGALLGGCSGGGPSISGEISITPELAGRLRGNEVLFVIAASPGGGPPVALQRLRAVEFPLRYYLTEADKLVPSATFTGQVNVSARLDLDGMMGSPQAGDMEGAYPGNPVTIGAKNVNFAINRLLTQPAGGEPTAPPLAAARPAAPALEAQRPAEAQAGYEAQRGAAAAPASEPRTIRGVITVAPELAQRLRGGEVVFLIARRGTPGPPLAVKRLAASSFPLPFSLGEADRMIATLPFEGEMELLARVDADGRAGPRQPGDMEGRAKATVGDQQVTITINELVSEGESGAMPPLAAPSPTAPGMPPAAGGMAPPWPDEVPGAASPAQGLAGMQPGGEKEEGGKLGGEISVAPELRAQVRGSEVLYIIVRGEAGGPPLAVKRIDAPKLPLRFLFTGADAMLHTAALQGKVRVIARLDADGMAGPPQPGDMEGEVAASVGEENLAIVISRRF